MSHLLVGTPAPQFKAKAVINGNIVEDFSLEDFMGKYVFFFFYPLDFTFVCPTELHSFQDYLPEFEKRNAQIIGCSVDSCHSHFAWTNTPKSQGGIQGVSYPLVSDLTKQISRSYHVLNEAEGIAYRGQFLIDKQGIIRHQLVNDLPLGRSIEEALRLLDALVSYETDGEVCPANWKSGERTFKANLGDLVNYFTVK